jgi:acylpyruvate hydrolase
MKIICIGRNYSEHAKELNNPLPIKPMFFLKPDTALLKGGHDFFLPEYTKDLHYECEVVVKISKAGKHIAKEFAHSYYNEIGLGIDFTARDLQEECKKNGHPWEIAKSFENSAPISENFIDKSQLDLSGIKFELKLNNNLVQNGNTKDFIFDIDTIISYVSIYIPLKTGDLIYTGTPAGVGPVKIGDELTGFLEGKEMFRFKIN